MKLATALIGLLVAGCEHDLVPDQEDAAVDAVAIPAGDFTCVGQPHVMAAPDPVAFVARVNNYSGDPIGGALVEIRQIADDVLLAQGMTKTAATGTGTYDIAVTTAGVAPAAYRKVTKDGLQDVYLIDAFPLFFSPVGFNVQMAPAADEIALDYQSTGVTPDPSRGTVFVDVLDCPALVASGSRKAGDAVAVAGATISTPPGSEVIYLSDTGVLDRSLTATVKNGQALILNAPVGTFDVTVTAGPYAYRSWPTFGVAGAFVYSPRSP